jgi:PTH1 family peptidyl-tRNA hydrolase
MMGRKVQNVRNVRKVEALAMRGIRSLWHRLWGRSEDSAGASTPPQLSSVSPAPTRLILGLGNPGPEYAATRHNIGFRVVDVLADRAGGEWARLPSLDALGCRVEIHSESCLLLKPQTFMNRSGEVVRAALQLWPGLRPSADLLVVYDELDLPTGRLRLRPRGGSGGHRGIANILDELDNKEIARLRVGVGHPGSAAAVVDWVLECFSEEEEAILLPELLARAADSIETAIREGVTVAMGQFNSVR